MSVIIQVLKETEVILPTAIVEALYREQRRLAQAGRQGQDARPSQAQVVPDRGTPFATSFDKARDIDMGHPEVRVTGRAPQSTKPIQSAKSKIVPEPMARQSG
jgi:hypothetical protein